MNNAQMASKDEKLANGSEDSGEITCLLCTATIAPENRVRLIPCSHNRFCKDCIFRWLREKLSCPLCRAPTAGVSTQDKILLTAGYDVGFDMMEAP
jgi:hypothetical protein